MEVKRVIIQQPNLGLDTFGSDPKFFGCFGNRLLPNSTSSGPAFFVKVFADITNSILKSLILFDGNGIKNKSGNLK